MSTKTIDESLRNRILDTALQLFIKNGISKTSMENISKACNISNSTLYQYFPTRQHILNFYTSSRTVTPEKLLDRLSMHKEKDCLMELYRAVVESMHEVTRPGWKRHVMALLIHSSENASELNFAKQQEIELSGKYIQAVESIFSSHREHLQNGLTPEMASIQLHILFYGCLSAILRDDENGEPFSDIESVFTWYFRFTVKAWP